MDQNEHVRKKVSCQPAEDADHSSGIIMGYSPKRCGVRYTLKHEIAEECIYIQIERRDGMAEGDSWSFIALPCTWVLSERGCHQITSRRTSVISVPSLVIRYVEQ